MTVDLLKHFLHPILCCSSLFQVTSFSRPKERSLRLGAEKNGARQGKGLDDPLRRFTKRTVDYGSPMVRWLEDTGLGDRRDRD